MLGRVKSYLLLRPVDLENPDPTHWRQSALRILVVSGLLLVLAISLHSSWSAIQLGAYQVLVILAAFYAGLFTVLYYSRRYVYRSAAGLLIAVLAAGLCMLFFIDNFELAKLGIIFVYTLPTIAMMFFTFRFSVFCMLLNILPFLFLLHNEAPGDVFGINITLPAAHSYLHGLLFLFFNLCLPLATARILGTLNRHSNKLQQLNRTISQSHDFYQELFEHNGSPTLLCSQNGRIIKANSCAKQLLGLTEEPYPNINQLLQCKTAQPQFWLHNDATCHLRQQPTLQLLMKHMMLTRQRHHILQLQDISAIDQLQQQLSATQQQQNLWEHYDRLTCLPNSRCFEQLVAGHLTATETPPLSLLLIVRLCHIKTLNQQFGYAFGSQVLQQFAVKAKAALPAETIFSRVRGVKFAMLVSAGFHQSQPQKISDMLFSQLPAELNVDGRSVVMQYQLGACTVSACETSVEALLQKCEIALELADNNRPVVLFDPEQALRLQQDYLLAVALKEAIRNHNLQVYLQPKVFSEGKICAFEALCRWHHEQSFIPPDVFIELAQQHGLIIDLSRVVLEITVQTLAHWQQQGWYYPIAINLAGPELLDDSFFASLLSFSADYPWLTAYLQLEITETNIAVQQPLLHKRLRALSQYGFSIAIDDFGTGHASLSQLVDLPADTIKIDRLFVKGIPHNKMQVKILYTTIQLAKSLQLTVVAEGVENDIQRRFLAKLGCHQQQGFFFGKPATINHWQQHIAGLQQQSLVFSPPESKGLPSL